MSQRDQVLVARLVSLRVVQVLEVVQVEEQRGALAAVAGRELQVALQLVVEAAPVRQPGQRVVVGEVLDLLLGVCTLGDVAHDADESAAFE